MWLFTIKCTVWKLHNFTATEILREIKFVNFEAPDAAALTFFAVLKCVKC